MRLPVPVSREGLRELEVSQYESRVVPFDRHAPSPVRDRTPELGEDDPQWVMAGFSTPTGVLLIASKTLTEGEFRRRMDGFDPGPLGAKIPRWVITLDCKMNDFVQILAETYPAAFQSLFQLWSPPERGHG